MAPKPPSDAVETAGDTSWPKTEQEVKCEELFAILTKTFKKIKRSKDADKLHGLNKEIGASLKQGKQLIKDFELEARTDGMPAGLLADRKRNLVSKINEFIAMKKEMNDANSAKQDLFAGAPQDQEIDLKTANMQQLVKQGHKELNEIDTALDRIERNAEDTLQIGTAAAQGLNDQTTQLNKIVDDLNEIEFTMKKATKVIRDITKGMLTDKCIGFLLFAVAAAVILLIVFMIVKPNFGKIAAATGLNDTFNLSNIIGSATGGLTSLANTLNNKTGVGGRRRTLLHTEEGDTGGLLRVEDHLSVEERMNLDRYERLVGIDTRSRSLNQRSIRALLDQSSSLPSSLFSVPNDNDRLGQLRGGGGGGVVGVKGLSIHQRPHRRLLYEDDETDSVAHNNKRGVGDEGETLEGVQRGDMMKEKRKEMMKRRAAARMRMAKARAGGGGRGGGARGGGEGGSEREGRGRRRRQQEGGGIGVGIGSGGPGRSD